MAFIRIKQGQGGCHLERERRERERAKGCNEIFYFIMQMMKRDLNPLLLFETTRRDEKDKSAFYLGKAI